MAYTKTILCLAASRKHQGKCFAGKCIQTGEWIRPVIGQTGDFCRGMPAAEWSSGWVA